VLDHEQLVWLIGFWLNIISGIIGVWVEVELGVGAWGHKVFVFCMTWEFSHPVNALNFCLVISCINTDCPRELQSICVSLYIELVESTHWRVKGSRTPAPTTFLECRNTSCPYPAPVLKDKLFA
jgi:hypothetical protein